MENIYFLLIAFIICWYFIYMRKVAEAAKKHALNYCSQSKLQFISIARKTSRLSFAKNSGLYFLSVFDFEFSGDGESSYQGLITLQGLKLNNIDVPAYRVH